VLNLSQQESELRDPIGEPMDQSDIKGIIPLERINRSSTKIKRQAKRPIGISLDYSVVPQWAEKHIEATIL